MEQNERKPWDVVGKDLALLQYWNEIPPKVQRQLLDSSINVCTLGELKKLAEELAVETTVPPEHGGG